MTPVEVRAVEWCASHGHPVLILSIPSSEEVFGIAITAEDAQSLALAPGVRTERTRLYDLVDWVLDELDGRLAEVELRVGDDRVLRALLRIAGPRGVRVVPVAIADAVALALRARAPLGFAAGEEARLRAAEPKPPQPATEPMRADPFRSFVESLDLDGLG
jgi:bifunctional DNase/RNase